MKITIIGSSGGGKSMLARKISDGFDIPRIEIDRVWFKHGGHKYLNSCDSEKKEIVSTKIRIELEEFLSKNQSWVIEGTYSEIQLFIAAQADTVVLIKRTLLMRILSHIVRVVKGKDRHHEVTKVQDLLFIKTIIKRWKKGEDDKIKKLSKQHKEKLVILRNFKEIDSYYSSLS
ncbi:MAG: hypothetical protein JKX80_00335 [Candidatus Pacebacteria bacterium]|nr:hypothetical protein [Candidatus Paceibacterota bacterium]